MVLYIKNMVCGRCITAVKNVLEDLKLPHDSIQLGEVQLKNAASVSQLTALKEKLQPLGFELLDDSKKRIIEKIKNIIIEQVHYGKKDKRYNLSE
jgi:copper chaperone CopZ